MKIENVVVKHKFGILDVIIFVSIGAILYMFISSGLRGEISVRPVAISTDTSMLPIYALKSVGRMTAAYALSFVFTLVYGYTAANNKRAEMIMIPILDILQSIPVLSFLPAVVLGLIAIFPNSSIGLEISSIILIFTGQAWNMTFSFYNSVKVIPRDLKEAAKTFQLTRWQQFKRVEVPFAAIGLVWNSMMSWAGGWFFLMACESFTLKGRDFRLQGLGSYLQNAAVKGDTVALFWGIVTLVAVIVLLDIFIWRPVITWSDKFKVELTSSSDEPHSFVLTMIRRSVIIETLSENIFIPLSGFLGKKIDTLVGKINNRKKGKTSFIFKSIQWVIKIAFILILIYAVFKFFILLTVVKKEEWIRIIPATLFSFGRVIAAQVLALLWTVPVGVAIGMNKKLANIFQPIIQVIASIPATALFPVILVFFINAAGGLGTISIFLMLLGTQWYILFNVIAGAMAIPEDLISAAKVYNLTGIKKWKTLILPGIFPYLLNGMITATGGCWNASIVSEYVNFAGKTVSTTGLGALIAESTSNGNYPLLLLGTLVMCIVVVGVNKTLWKRLYYFAEERFKIDM